jgi:hypothetical protein
MKIIFDYERQMKILVSRQVKKYTWKKIKICYLERLCKSLLSLQKSCTQWKLGPTPPSKSDLGGTDLNNKTCLFPISQNNSYLFLKSGTYKSLAA